MEMDKGWCLGASKAFVILIRKLAAAVALQLLLVGPWQLPGMLMSINDNGPCILKTQQRAVHWRAVS
jgi:hypothetical protein